jgi:hypothetical protein
MTERYWYIRHYHLDNQPWQNSVGVVCHIRLQRSSILANKIQTCQPDHHRSHSDWAPFWQHVQRISSPCPGHECLLFTPFTNRRRLLSGTWHAFPLCPPMPMVLTEAFLEYRLPFSVYLSYSSSFHHSSHWLCPFLSHSHWLTYLILHMTCIPNLTPLCYKEGNNTFLWNTGNYLQEYAVSEQKTTVDIFTAVRASNGIFWNKVA